jgi:hypothetical protein
MKGHYYCWHHRWHGKPQFAGLKGFDRTPLLEDTASIQDIVSRTMQGLLEGKLSENGARVAFYGAAVANAVLRTDLQRRRFLAEHGQNPEESVAEATNLDSDPLAPAQQYRGPDNQFEPSWSFSKYRYEEECKRLGKALPQSAADMPISGWITEEEEDEEVATWAKRYEDKIAAMKETIRQREAEESAAALAAGLPDPHPKPRSTDCPYGIDWCAGYRGDHRCTYCKGQLDWNEIHPNDPPIDPPTYSPLYKNPESDLATAASPQSDSLRPEPGSQSPDESTLDLNAAAAVPELSALSSVFPPAPSGPPMAYGLCPKASSPVIPKICYHRSYRKQSATQSNPHPCRARSGRASHGLRGQQVHIAGRRGGA